MRKLWPLVAALALGAVGPLPAQFSLTSQNGKTGMSSASPTNIGLPQMMPQMNLGQSLGNPLSKSKTFSFSSMMPNFSYLRNNIWPIKSPTTTLPPGYTTTGKKK
jgi:hypothetical protein